MYLIPLSSVIEDGRPESVLLFVDSVLSERQFASQIREAQADADEMVVDAMLRTADYLT